MAPHFVNRLRVGAASPTSVDNAELQFLKVLKKVYQTIDRNEARIQEQDRKDILKQEWQQLAFVLDRMLLLIFILVSVTVTLVVMIPQEYDMPISTDGGV